MHPLLTLAAIMAGLVLIDKGRAAPLRAGRTLRNPGPRLTGTDRRDLALATDMSRRFHGDSHVVELTPAERRPLPRFVAEVGKLEEVEYAPPAGSDRAGASYSHESGDRGPLRPRDRRRPLLVAAPPSGRPAIVPRRSKMRLTGAGLVG